MTRDGSDQQALLTGHTGTVSLYELDLSEVDKVWIAPREAWVDEAVEGEPVLRWSEPARRSGGRPLGTLLADFSRLGKATNQRIAEFATYYGVPLLCRAHGRPIWHAAATIDAPEPGITSLTLDHCPIGSDLDGPYVRLADVRQLAEIVLRIRARLRDLRNPSKSALLADVRLLAEIELADDDPTRTDRPTDRIQPVLHYLGLPDDRSHAGVATWTWDELGNYIVNRLIVPFCRISGLHPYFGWDSTRRQLIRDDAAVDLVGQIARAVLNEAAGGQFTYICEGCGRAFQSPKELAETDLKYCPDVECRRKYEAARQRRKRYNRAKETADG